jgi:hypothetical protein
MGCNCGKAKTRPAPAAPRPAPTPTGGKLSGPTQTFELTADDRTQTFGSELEANAARVRLGFGVVSRRR